MTTISLLGCGYLGFPLAIELIKKGYYVKGSTTTPTKLQQLKKTGASMSFGEEEEEEEKNYHH